MMRTLDTNQRTKSQTCWVLSIYIPRPAEIDSQHLQQTWCEQKFFLTKWIGKQTNTSSTDQHRKSKLRTTTNQISQLAKCNNSLTCWPLDSQNGMLNGIVAGKESCIFHCPHWMVLRLPRTSLAMVGRAASRCTVCHHCHYHSSKMMHWTQISEQSRRHVVLFQSTSRDLQRLILNNCSKRGVSKNYVLLPAIKCSQLLLQMDWKGKQIRVQLINIAKASQGQMTPTKASADWKFSNSSHADLNRVRTNKQIPIDNGLSAKQWAGEQIQSQNLNASMCNIRSLKWPPVAPFATCQPSLQSATTP